MRGGEIYMKKMVLGIFSTRQYAEEALNALESKGYNPKDISILMKDKKQGKELAEDTGTSVAGGAVSGATTGAVIGGIAGLLAATVLPGIGAFLIGGPIAAALGLSGAAASTVSGAATGALAGGILGALTGLGVSEDDAKMYESEINKGGILVMVPARVGYQDEASDILSSYNASQIRTVDIKLPQSKATDKAYEEKKTARPAMYPQQYGMAGGRSSSDDNEGKGWHGDSKGHSEARKKADQE
jgi:uncharacterized membrane protein